MDSADALLGGLASGDSTQPTPPEPALKRDQDSTDDFEHLEREAKPEGESPHHPRITTQSFLDMERDVFVDTPRAPSVTDKMDHIADKFTDSESDADTAGESPLHRPAPAVPAHAAPASAPAPALLLDLLSDPLPAPVPAALPTPALVTLPAEKPAPAPAPAPAPTPAPASVTEPKAAPAPVPEPAKPAPVPQQQPAPKPVPSEPTRAPVAHVIEAEVIFCQMGLGKLYSYYSAYLLQYNIGR